MQAGSHRLTEWETDLSSQTGASQAGILLGNNEDIPAFRWADKETGKLIDLLVPGDCAEIERRLRSGHGLLIDDGASRGNLFSGDADAVILTASRMTPRSAPTLATARFWPTASTSPACSSCSPGKWSLERLGGGPAAAP